MAVSIIQYPFYTTESLVHTTCNRGGVFNSPLYNWLLFGKLPERVVAPSIYYTRFVTPSAKNRYLSEVVVRAIEPSTGTVTLAVGATATYTIPEASSVTTSDSAIATATITSGVVTVTGVAAGTSTVVIKDQFDNTISTITVTVA